MTLHFLQQRYSPPTDCITADSLDEFNIDMRAARSLGWIKNEHSNFARCISVDSAIADRRYAAQWLVANTMDHNSKHSVHRTSASPHVQEGHVFVIDPTTSLSINHPP